MSSLRNSRRLSFRSNVKEQVEIAPEDAELRDGLKWQCTIVDAITAYVDTVGAAFHSLSQAQKNLAAAGIDITDWPSNPLLERLCGASDHIAKVAEATRGPLKKTRDTLQACYDDLKLADSAATELKRYRDKVEELAIQNENGPRQQGVLGNIFGGRKSLMGGDVEGESPAALEDQPSENGRAPKRHSIIGSMFAGRSSQSVNSDGESDNSRIARNREKMIHWQDETNLRHSRATDMLVAIKSRQDSLIENVRDIAQSVVTAVCVAAGTRPLVEFASEWPMQKPIKGPLVFDFNVALPARPLEPGHVIGEREHPLPHMHLEASHSATRTEIPTDRSTDLPTNSCSSFSDQVERYGEGALHLRPTSSSEASLPAPTRGDNGLIDEDTSDLLIADIHINGSPIVVRRVPNVDHPAGTRLQDPNDFSVPVETLYTKPFNVEVLSPFSRNNAPSAGTPSSSKAASSQQAFTSAGVERKGAKVNTCHLGVSPRPLDSILGNQSDAPFNI